MHIHRHPIAPAVANLNLPVESLQVLAVFATETLMHTFQNLDIEPNLSGIGLLLFLQLVYFVDDECLLLDEILLVPRIQLLHLLNLSTHTAVQLLLVPRINLLNLLARPAVVNTAIQHFVPVPTVYLRQAVDVELVLAVGFAHDWAVLHCLCEAGQVGVATLSVSQLFSA